MNELIYHAAYYPIEDGWYLIRVLDFPGTVTQGKDLEDARWMIRDALRLMAECTLERGDPLPRPNPRARDKKAERIEPLGLSIRVSQVKPHEAKKTTPASSRT
jgi:predicted RNase H-like HicB family nuclease